MFHQYLQMAQRIRKHYLSPRVLLCLVTGKFVPPIDRKNLYSLQYSMLPARRPGIWEMWSALTAGDKSWKGVGPETRMWSATGWNNAVGRRFNANGNGFAARARYGR